VDDGTYTYSTVTGYTKVNSTPDGKVDYYKADIITANDYYPFGMMMPGRKYNAPGKKDYKYGFNGKENDNDVKGVEGGQQDYGLRIYDPRLGKFLSVDPLTRSYPMLTPYAFAENDVISAIDLDGLEKVKFQLIVNDDGTTKLQYLGTDEKGERKAWYGDKSWDWPFHVSVKFKGEEYLFAPDNSEHSMKRWIDGYEIFGEAYNYSYFSLFKKDPEAAIAAGVESIQDQSDALKNQIIVSTIVGLTSEAIGRSSPFIMKAGTANRGRQSTVTGANKKAAAVHSGNNEALEENVAANSSKGNGTASNPITNAATKNRVKLRANTVAAIKLNQPRNSNGVMVDPNTNQPLQPGKVDIGHKPGQEWHRRKQVHIKRNSTRKEVIEAENNPNLYHLEDRHNNRCHRYEQKKLDI
jgi:RHS repeat-associated protein